MRILIFVFCSLIVGELGQCANIVAVIPTPYRSHQATFRPFWRELASRGHKIFLLTTHLMEHNENITQIDLSETIHIHFVKHQAHEAHKNNITLLQMFTFGIKMVDDIYHFQLTHPDVVNLLKSKTKIDLLFVETVLPIFPVLSVIWKCPFIGLTSLDALPHIHELAGNPDHPALYPFALLGIVNKMSFMERIKSTSVHLLIFFFTSFVFPIFGNNIAKKYITEDLPDIMEVQKNASLLFVNANPIFYPPRPLTPTTINVGGGIHIEKPKSLPKDLQVILDQSTHGCIYFSFGTVVDNNFLNPEGIEIFRKTFEELDPIRVLWKLENTTLPNKPRNVEIRKWFPQQDILRHPNVKMFITQGGLQSLEEAVYFGVPVLGIPFLGDQFSNVNKVAFHQIGLKLDMETLDKESLKISILEIMQNTLFKENIDRFSAITKDRPMSPLEEALWWTDYVLRHRGTEHLRSPSADIPLYQYFFLDIIAFTICVSIFIVFVFYYLYKMLKYLFKMMFARTKKEKKN